MIVYVDSSVVVRSYLADEKDHRAVRAMFDDPEVTAITCSWTRIEVTGSLVRAARANRGDEAALLAEFEHDISDEGGQLLLVDVHHAEAELVTLDIVRRTGLRTMDAWHLACATLALEDLADPGERFGFATRDAEQAAVARELGFVIL